MTKVGGIRKIMVLWQAVFLAASPLVTALPSNLTRLYYNGSAAKSHSTTTQYRQLRRLNKLRLSEGETTVYMRKIIHIQYFITWRGTWRAFLFLNFFRDPKAES